jgi:murein DD-endopeptidase MepM/ murein hydrolase activator NlpD
MSRGKYRFNPETLSYEHIQRGWKARLARFFGHFGTSIVMAIGIFFLVATFWGTPKERRLQRDLDKMDLFVSKINKQLDMQERILTDLQERDDNIYRTLLGAEPMASDVRQAGFGGAKRYKELEGMNNSELLIEVSTRLDHTLKKMYVQSKSYDELIKMARSKEDMLASVPAIQPVALDELTRIASYFGWRKHPIYGIMKMHEGMDFSAPHGTKVYATGNGTVKRAGYMSGYGKIITIDHGYGYTTRYAHLSSILVREGEKVARGQNIGKVGNTGLSVAPHLHYEVRKNRRPLNPINFFFNDLTPEEYNRMIELSAQGGGISLD